MDLYYSDGSHNIFENHKKIPRNLITQLKIISPQKNRLRSNNYPTLKAYLTHQHKNKIVCENLKWKKVHRKKVNKK